MDVYLVYLKWNKQVYGSLPAMYYIGILLGIFFLAKTLLDSIEIKADHLHLDA